MQSATSAANLMARPNTLIAVSKFGNGVAATSIQSANNAVVAYCVPLEQVLEFVDVLLGPLLMSVHSATEFIFADMSLDSSFC